MVGLGSKFVSVFAWDLIVLQFGRIIIYKVQGTVANTTGPCCLIIRLIVLPIYLKFSLPFPTVQIARLICPRQLEELDIIQIAGVCVGLALYYHSTPLLGLTALTAL